MASQALVLRVGTDLAPAQRALAQFATTAGASLALASVAAKTAAADLKLIGSSSLAAADTMAKLAPIVGRVGLESARMVHSSGGILRLITTYKALSMAVGAVGAVAAIAAIEVAKIQSIARGSSAAGVSGEFFQSFINSAERVKLSARESEAAMVSAKRALSEQSDAQGKQTINPVMQFLDETYRGGMVQGRGLGDFLGAENAEQKIQAVKIAIKELLQSGNELQAMKLGEMAFGGAGEKIVEGIQKGKIEVEAMGAAAASVGAIFQNELVARSKELDERVRAAQETMQSGLAPIMADLARLGLEFRDGWVSTREFIAQAATAAGELYTIVKNIGDLIPSLNLGEKTAAWLNKNGMTGSQDERRDQILRAAIKSPAFAGSANSAKITADAARLDAGAINWSTGLPAGAGANLPAAGPMPPTRPTLSSMMNQSSPAASRGAAGGAGGADSVESFLESLRRSVETLQAEAAAYGKSNTERERAIALARAESAARQRGSELTDTEIADIQRLADERAKAKQVLDSQQSMDQFKDFAGSNLISAIRSATDGTKGLAEAARRVADNFADAALQALILNKGPLAMGGGSGGGILGALFNGFTAAAGAGGGGMVPTGGAFHTGGLVSMGGPSMPASLFAGAPRFHSGGAIGGRLAPGEVPIIAQAGEIVLNAAQQAGVASRLSRGGSAPVVNNFMVEGVTTPMDVQRMVEASGNNATRTARRAAPGDVADRNLRYG